MLWVLALSTPYTWRAQCGWWERLHHPHTHTHRYAHGHKHILLMPPCSPVNNCRCTWHPSEQNQSVSPLTALSTPGQVQPLCCASVLLSLSVYPSSIFVFLLASPIGENCILPFIFITYNWGSEKETKRQNREEDTGRETDGALRVTWRKRKWAGQEVCRLIGWRKGTAERSLGLLCQPGEPAHSRQRIRWCHLLPESCPLLSKGTRGGFLFWNHLYAKHKAREVESTW